MRREQAVRAPGFKMELALLFALAAASPAAGQSWLDAPVGLRPSPVEKGAPLDMRIKAVKALGRHAEGADAVELLLGILQERPEPESEFVREVLLALARLRSPMAVPALREGLEKGEGDPELILLALAASGEREAAEALVGALDRPELADQAGEALERMGAAAVAPLLDRLGSAGAGRAARVLGAIGDPAAFPALIRELGAAESERRLAALGALEELGDERAGPAVGRLLEREQEQDVRQAALEALGRVGTAGQVPLLRRLVEGDHPGEALIALRALLEVDADSARPGLESRLRSDDQSAREAALGVLLQSPGPATIPLLVYALEKGWREREVASALAAIADGQGLRALVDRLAGTPQRVGTAALAVALGLRRWRFALDATERASALRLVRRAKGEQRGILARSLARDPEVAEELYEALRSEDARTRAVAAHGIGLLGHGVRADELVRALRQESDPEAFRRLATAAFDLGIDVPAVAAGWLSDRATAPEALLLAARSAPVASPARRARLAVALRRALRSRNEGPRCRAAAALGLALMRERSAHRALRAALDDGSPRVRLAAVRALWFLDAPGWGETLKRHAAVERDREVRGEALRALLALDRGYRQQSLLLRGEQSLYLRLTLSPGLDPHAVLVDLLPADGRWLRFRPAPDGWLLVADLPPGSVEVRMVDSHAR